MIRYKGFEYTERGADKEHCEFHLQIVLMFASQLMALLLNHKHPQVEEC